MACLDRLQRLRISAQLLSPAAVGVLADLPALTHLHLDQLDLGSYGGYLLQADGSEPWVGASALAEEIKKFKVRNAGCGVRERDVSDALGFMGPQQLRACTGTAWRSLGY